MLTILTGSLWLLPGKQAAGGRVKEGNRETSEDIVLSHYRAAIKARGDGGSDCGNGACEE